LKSQIDRVVQDRPHTGATKLKEGEARGAE